jgi:LysR family transcriptional regulator, nod-box dependent transcriptional activator
MLGTIRHCKDIGLTVEALTTTMPAWRPSRPLTGDEAVSILLKFDLNLLRILSAVLRERSVTHAANKLHVTQQAISNSLRRLREHFEDPLLVRVGRHMELSPLARALDQPLSEALANLEAIMRLRPEFEPGTTARTFRIGMPHYAAFFLMPQVLRRLAAEAPKIVLETGVPGSSPYAALDRGDLDLVIVDESTGLDEVDPARAKLCRQLLLSDDFVCVADKDHPDIHDELGADLYARLPHCLTRFAFEGQTPVERAWRELGLQPYVAATAPGFVVSLFTVPGTGLLGTVPRKLAALHAATLSLTIHECPIAIGPIHEHLFWHPRNNDDPAHAYLRSLFQCASVTKRAGESANSSVSVNGGSPANPIAHRSEE